MKMRRLKDCSAKTRYMAPLVAFFYRATLHISREERELEQDQSLSDRLKGQNGNAPRSPSLATV